MTDDRIIWVLIGLLAAIVVVLFRPTKPAFSRNDITGTVRYIVDGDSLYLEGVDPQIRIWGINAPEIREPGYTAAKSALYALAHGKNIRCEKRDIDRYDRIVGRCFLPDGRDIGLEMIRAGHAVEYTRFTKGFYRDAAKQ